MKIVAIGGGEIGRPGYPVETLHIDKGIIGLSGKPKPRLLFVPTASGDSQSYIDNAEEHFAKRLPCQVRALKLYDKISFHEISEAIEWADIVYVGGGNTLKMMMRWRKLGVDNLLCKAATRGTVLAGLSAGAICWFAGGLSDSRSFTSHGESWNYITVRGLGLHDLRICPHFSSEPKRKAALKRSLQGSSKVAIALDNCVALQINGNTFRVIDGDKEHRAYKAYWFKGKYYLEELNASDDMPTSTLLARPS